MPVSVVMQSLSEQQAAALRSAEMSSADLATEDAASYDGSGDVTHIGCGCALTLIVLVGIALPTWRHFGWQAALVVLAIFEALIIRVAWELRSIDRKPRNADAIDPLLVLPNEAELWLHEWNALHYLLTGTDTDGEPPGDFLLHAGTPLPESEADSEYGPPRLVAVEQLSEISSALARLNLDGAVELLEEANETTPIYPGRFDEASLSSELKQLRWFIERAIERGERVLIQLA